VPLDVVYETAKRDEYSEGVMCSDHEVMHVAGVQYDWPTLTVCEAICLVT